MRNESADSLDELKHALADNAESLFLELFGEPTSRTRREWRANSKGSISVSFKKKEPEFYSFEAERGGGLLQAIMFALNLDLGGAIEWAKCWIGGERTGAPPLPKPSRTLGTGNDERESIEAARLLWKAGRSIEGTAAERYLKARGIGCWPAESVRFIGARDVWRAGGMQVEWPAIMFPATDGAGNVQAVQLVALNDDGSPRKRSNGSKLKLSRGHQARSAVRFPGNQSKYLLLAEGPETALSVWLSFRDFGLDVWASLGSIAKAPLDAVPKDRLIVVCRDDDPWRTQSSQTLRKVIKQWRGAGRTVHVVTPWRRTRRDKSDFNDLLKEGGPTAIRARFDEVLSQRSMPDGHTFDVATARLDHAIQSALAEMATPRARSAKAPFLVTKATLGLGKTEMALRACAGAIKRGHAVACFLPNHTLTEETQRRSERICVDLGVEACIRIWRGRARPDPDDRSKTMCMNLKVAEAARLAGLDVGATVCEVCPHKASCAYLRQVEDDMVDLWIVPTSMVWLPRPECMSNIDMIVVDESFAQGGMVGFDGQLRVTKEDLEAQPSHGSGRDAATADLRAELKPLREKLLFVEHKSALIERSSLLAVGLIADDARRAAKLEKQRRVAVKVTHGTSEAELLKMIERAKGNASVDTALMLWKEVARVLDDTSGRPSGRALVECDEGGALAGFRLFGAKPYHKDWAKLPTLHMDATANMTLIKARVPHAKLLADIDVAMPSCVTVRQYTGRAFGKHDLTTNDHSIRKAWWWSVDCARKAGGHWLIVTHKGTEDIIRERFAVPDFIELAHFGKVAGRDEWKGVRGADLRGVIVLGRMGPPNSAMERAAGVMTGRAVEPAGEWYPTETVLLTAADGTSCTVDADRHPDPLTEALRWTACEGEVMQAVGRGRGVRRDASRPLDIVILGNVPLPLKLDSVALWEPLDVDDAMMAEFGAVPSSAEDAAKLVGSTRDAIKKARTRSGTRPRELGTFSYYYYLYENVPTSGFITYRRAGAHGSALGVTYDARRIENPRAWLETIVGPITMLGHHDPEAPGGAVRCRVTGRLNFAFARHHDQGENLTDDERLAIVPEDCR